jgi:gliding motility-associated-like protein
MTTISSERMMHPLRMFFLALILSVGITAVNAQQSEGWAGGEIVFEYVSGDCLDPNNDVRYNVILKFYRDNIGVTGNNFPATLPVFVFSPDNNIPINSAFAHEVTLIPNSERNVQQYCLNSNRDATEGAWYRSTNPIVIKANELGNWFFAFVGRYGGNFRSSADRNIALGQNFYIESRLNFNCGNVVGTIFDPVTQTNIDTTVYNPPPEFSPTEYVFDDPVASFCVGKTYEWNIKAIPGNNVEDVEFEFAPIFTFRSQLANYLVNEGYSIKSPFPTNGIIDDSDLENRGILRFTAQKPFTGPVPFFVRNIRRVWRIQDGSPVNRLERGREFSVVSQREYRFIFDNNCNSRLPNFEAGILNPQPGNPIGVFQNTFNPVQNAYEYDCATTEFIFQLTEPVLTESLGLIGVPYDEQDQGFRFESVIDTTGFLDDIAVEKVEPLRIVNIDETDLLKVTLSRRVGPGRYRLFMKKGDDLNTLVNRCESVLPEDSTLAFIYVNDNFDYNHLEDNYSYCFPAGKPPTARISIDDADYVGWKYFGGERFFPPGSPGNPTFDDTIFFDTTYLGPKRFTLDRPDDPDWFNSKIEIGAGWWRVGAGYDFSTYDQQTGQIIEERICYGEDQFFVDTVTVEDLEIPDFDLCPQEDLPVIDLTAYSNDIIQNSFQWGKWDQTGGPSGNGLVTFTDQFGEDSLGRKYDRVSTKSSTFDVASAFTFGSGTGELPTDTNVFRALFSMRGKFVRNRTCPVQIEFKVLKQLVPAKIRPKNSTICEDEEYTMYNADSLRYFKPEQMSFLWFFESDTLEQYDSLKSRVQGTGWHILEATKTTQDTFCITRDSLYVEIAPELDSISAICSEVTFKNGQVQQEFTWPAVPFAKSYDVRIVQNADTTNPNNFGPWVKSNGPGEPALSHRTIGRQVALQIRAVNDSVDADAICRLGDISYAKPCEAIVKPTNVFTPNGDGINDFLKFDLVEIFPGSKLIVFNRWGNKVYEDTDYFNDWDGGDLQEGTYFYILDINDPDEQNDLMKGTFTIIRD